MRYKAFALFAATIPAVASGQGIRGLPPQVQAEHQSNARECTEMGNKLEIGPDYVLRTDFNGDGKTDYVLDWHALDCVGAASLYGGSAGSPYDIFISSGERYIHSTVIGDDGALVRRGTRSVLRLAEKDGKTHFWGWNGKAFARVN